MTKSFNSKTYRGKARVYIRVPGTVNISRLFVWHEALKEYQAPARGKCYLAKRWDPDGNGKRERKAKYFEKLDEARAWQQRRDGGDSGEAQCSSSDDGEGQKYSGPLFGDVVAKFKRVRYPSLGYNTKVRYDNLARLYFDDLLPMHIDQIKPAVIDSWIEQLHRNINKFNRGTVRTSFREELKFLSTVMNFHREYEDEFVSPLRGRHRKAIAIKTHRKAKPRDLNEDRLNLAIAELATGPDGDMMVALGTMQFYQALRISEAAGVHWEDVRLDFANPRKSRVTFTRHVIYPRIKGAAPFIDPGFKNSEALGGQKEHPLMPATFKALAKLYQPGATGLIFRSGTNAAGEGILFTYREIQYRYERAFERAKLPYSATHIMRHGGTRKGFDDTKGDQGVAQQLLGNMDRKSIETYAVRAAVALTEYADSQWSLEEAANGGRKWSQTGTELAIVKPDPEVK